MANPDGAFSAWTMRAPSAFMMDGRPLPLVSELLYAICGGDTKKFDRAIEMLRAAFDEGVRFSERTRGDSKADPKTPTPEERAKDLILTKRDLWFEFAGVGDWMGNSEMMIEDIAASIRSAVAAETQRCIAVAKSVGDRAADGKTGAGAGTAVLIAAEIEAGRSV